MKRLWMFSLLLCLGCYQKGQEVTFLTPLIKHTDAQGNTKVYIARPKGEYASIDIKDSHEAFVTLVSNSVQPIFQFNMANRIGANPGIYNPSALLALGILRLRHKDYEQGAFFVRAALLRTYIDVQLSQDPSLQGLGQIMTQQVHQFVPNLNEEAFFKAWDAVAEEVITWDKEVPRLYDRRWASLHSIGFYTQKPLNYLPLSEEPRIIEEAHDLFLNQS
ncbi:MAG: hypothetical protein H7A39_02515 [Chlamydiales bacterium]|nr:hypothetical protein [Chlamydiales bacterium]